MVQFGDVAAIQVEGEASVSYVQPQMTSLDQLPHTSLPLPLSGQKVPPSHLFPLLPESPETMEVSSDVHALQSSAPNSVSGHNVFESVPFSIFSTIDNMPNTCLDADISTTSFSKPFSFNDTTGDLSSDVSRVFEVMPVVGPYSDNTELDNMKEQRSSYPVSSGLTALGGSIDNIQALDSIAMDNQVQKEERVDSLDSLTDKSYLSDSSSDVYMNSDYTDTITSTDSSAFFLPPSDFSHKEAEETKINEVFSPAATESPEPTFYKNEAFSDSTKQSTTMPSELDFKQEAENASGESSLKGEDWCIHITDVDAETAADREDEAKEVGGACNGMEELVQQLVEQHPSQVIDIQVQVLDGPVYEHLTEPLPGEGWLQSTESLHHYKLLKQGRFTPFSPSSTSLLPRAVTNLQANTMNNLHERSSFLNLTAASVTSLGRVCQKALTHVRTDMEFGSMMSLRDSAKLSSTLASGERGLLPSDMEALNKDLDKKDGEPSVASGRHTRNVVYMALVITLLLISVNATKNLQSSLNQEGGVGIMCLAVTSGAYMLGSVLSPVLVQGLGVKRCLTFSLLLQLLYVAANLHPTLWLMLPAAFGGGASLAFIWNAMSTYLVLLARGEAQYSQRSYERVSDKFFGIFCLIYQSNLVVGNLISSLILTFGDGDQVDAAAMLANSTANTTDAVLDDSVAMTTASPSLLSSLHQAAADLLLGANEGAEGVAYNSSSASTAFDAAVDSHYQLCGSNYCHHFVLDQASSAVPARTVYLLFGIFLFLIVLALVMTVCLLEPISPSFFAPGAARTSPWRTVRAQVVSLVKFCRNAKFLLLLPLMLYTAMQFSFVCSEVMLAYVTCPVGVWLVGFTMMAYGISCSLSCYLTQLLVPRTGRAPFIAVVIEKIKVLI